MIGEIGALVINEPENLSLAAHEIVSIGVRFGSNVRTAAPRDAVNRPRNYP